ncbi:nucleotidyltransferase family protein [Patescibacteria group bacterium]|nr:nucleotidyltransferase family protein [Patescibacteria group bacterium]
MDLVSLLKLVTNRLEKAKIPYMLTGGVAVSYWGYPRTTHDIDIVIEAKKEDKEKIVALFEKDFYISAEAAEDAIKTRFTFNILHHQTGLKVDFWLVKKDLFGVSEFKRKLKKKMFGEEIFIISPEDLILTKLLAYKETQSHRRLEDAKSILKTSKVDLKYIKRWAEKQSTIKILEEIL